MKKFAAVLAVLVLVVSLVSMAAAAEMKKGTIKSVDAKSGMVMLMVDGKDMHLTADKSVDLSKLKAGDVVEATIEKHELKAVTVEAAPAAKPKAPVGC